MFLGTRRQQCSLEMWLFMSKMSRSTLRLVSNSTTQWVVHEEQGNSNERWERFRYKIGLIRQNFSLIFEVVPEGSAAALVALDNLRLVDCFDGEESDTWFSRVSFIRINATSHFSTTATWIRYQIKPSYICGERSGNRVGFHPALCFPCQL
jgi:hypothetical protein